MANYQLVPVSHDPWANLPSGPTELHQGPRRLRDAASFGDFMQILGEQLGETETVQGLKSFATLPHDVMTGEVDLNSPEGKRRAFDMALQMMQGGPRPGGAAAASGWGPLLNKGLKSKSSPTPYSGSIESHPALAELKKGGEIHTASKDILEALKSFPDEYKTPTEVVKGYVKDGWIEKSQEVPYLVAAGHLENYADKNGPFKFGEAAPKIAPPFSFSQPEDIIKHPALKGLSETPDVNINSEKEAGKQILHSMHMSPQKYPTPQSVVDAWYNDGLIAQEEKDFYSKPVSAIQNYVEKNGQLNFLPAPKLPLPAFLQSPLAGLQSHEFLGSLSEQGQKAGAHIMQMMKENPDQYPTATSAYKALEEGGTLPKVNAYEAASNTIDALAKKAAPPAPKPAPSSTSPSQPAPTPTSPFKSKAEFFNHYLDNDDAHKWIPGLESDAEKAAAEKLLYAQYWGDKVKKLSPDEAMDHLISQNSKHALQNPEAYSTALSAIKQMWPENAPSQPAPKPSISEMVKAYSGHPLEQQTARNPIAEALYPVNWLDLQSTVARPASLATGEYANKLEQAQALGFNPNLMLFHGSTKGLPYEHAPGVNILAPAWENKYNTSLGPMNAFADPLAVKPGHESGIFFSDAPEVANQYSGTDPWNPIQTIPVLANPKNTFAVHWPQVAGNQSYSGDMMNQLIREAHKRNADMLVVHGIHDVGGQQTQYVALKHNILRSPFAKFNPERASSPVLTDFGTPMLIPVDHDPFKEEQK